MITDTSNATMPSISEPYQQASGADLAEPESVPDAQSAEPQQSAGEAIANLLIKTGHVTPEQLRYALRIRSKLHSGNTLIRVLQELHFVQMEEVRETLRANILEIPLGALLVELGYLRESDLKMALSLQKENPGVRLGRILMEHHFLAEEDLVEVLSFQLGFENLTPSLFQPDPEFLRFAPISWFRARDCVPLARRDGKILMAFADPMDRPQVEATRRLFDVDLAVGIARFEEIHQALNRLEAAKGGRASVQNTENLVVQTVNDIINHAIESEASDVHLEPMKDRLRIRYRKDGVLVVHKEIARDLAPPVLSRIKIMSSVDIAEKRRHQDGRIAFEYKGQPLDIRVSTYGTIFGEKIVMRVLNNRNQLREIREIGMAPEVLRRYLEDALDAPSGVVIITGPTGSGKTTTLYASVQYLNSPQTSIITAEDPVEYVVEGISQCSINPKINVTFEDTLKHMVRQDPDIMVIGEIRDLFSAETAIQAALTGHKVLTTFHTEDSIGGLLRLLNMNIEAFLISSTVVSVIAQRLLRRLCPHCAEDEPLTAQQVRQLGYESRDSVSLTFKKGRGCSRCHHTGYFGRIPVFELLVLNEVVKDAIIARKTSYEIRRLSIESTGLVTLVEDAIFKATRGLTTCEEIIRQVPRLSKPRTVGVLRKLLGEM
jgi:type IV pilus assembly protein PilB